MKSRSSFGHAFSMVLKNKGSYLMLSVTIVMSFTFLLSFLMYTDSKVMTEYTAVIKSEPYIMETYVDGVDKDTKYMYMRQLDKLEDTNYFIIDETVISDDSVYDYRELFGIVTCIPKNAWTTFKVTYDYEIVTSDNTMITLDTNQACVREEVYRKLKEENKGEKIMINLPIEMEDGSTRYIEVEVVGGFKDKNVQSVDEEAQTIVISEETFKGMNRSRVNEKIYIYSHCPQKVLEISEMFDLNTNSLYEEKKVQYPHIRKDLRNKAIIAIILFILLGINLYSSFQNALNERKFEIGVKRAIGASGGDIIKQFLYEGMIVVATNIVISTLLSFVIFIGYKYYMDIIVQKKFIFYISKESWGMYIVASIFLTVVFSLLFAIKSSRVEIIKYLKAE